MDLQRGITGILSRKDPMPVQACTDLKAFRSHCHDAARETGAKIQSIKDSYDGVGICSFAIALFEFSDSTVAVLLNVIRPIIAFSKSPSEGQILFEYIDCSKLAEVFQAFGTYSISISHQLNQPLVRNICKNLAPAEQEQVRYFRPARVGDLIFNSWD